MVYTELRAAFGSKWVEQVDPRVAGRAEKGCINAYMASADQDEILAYADARVLFELIGDNWALIDSIPSRASDPAQLVAGIDEGPGEACALKPAEQRVIGLLAAGYSYREVGEITGFTYTKQTAAPPRAGPS